MNQASEFSLDVNQAIGVLQAGGLVALPTETVYGLGADARNAQAIERIFAAKGRPIDHPLIVHIGDARQITEWAKDVPQAAWQLAKAFWPGPLTLILRRQSNVLDLVTGGLDTVALRVPNHPLALELLRAFGGGVAAPSANRYGRVSPTSAEDVREELEEKVDFILDGGRCSIGIESTIVDISNGAPRILRPGKITQEELCRVLGSSLTTPVKKPECYPGSNPSHYAPRARVILASWDDVEERLQEWQQCSKKVGLLASNSPNTLPKNVTWLRLTQNIDEQAHELYRTLRQADRLGLEVLVAVIPPDVGVGRAVRDRLHRAAGLGDHTHGD